LRLDRRRRFPGDFPAGSVEATGISIVTYSGDRSKRSSDYIDRSPGKIRGTKARGKYRLFLWVYFLVVIFFIGVGQVSVNREGAPREQPVFRFSLPARPGISFSIGGKLENLVLPLLLLWGLGAILDPDLRPGKNPLDPPLLVFLGVAFLSFVFSPFRELSWQGGLRELLLGGGFLVVARVLLAPIRRRKIAVALLFISVGISALAGLYLFSRQIYFPDTPQRIWLSFMHPNTTGSVLLLLIPLGISLSIGGFSRLPRVICGLTTVLFGLTMILTFSRTAWMGLLIASGVLVMYWRLRFYLLGALALLAALLLVGVNIGPQTYLQDRVKSISSFTHDPNISKRLIYWEGVFRMIGTRPFLGYGPGYRVFMEVYERDFLEIPTGEDPVHAHNIYLALGAGIGIPGLLAFLWLLQASFGVIHRGKNREKEKFQRYYGRGLTAGLAGFLVAGLADNPLFSFRVMLVLWFLLAAASAGENRFFRVVKGARVG